MLFIIPSELSIARSRAWKACRSSQPGKPARSGTIEIYPEYAQGLKDLEGFSFIILALPPSQSVPFITNRDPFPGLRNPRYLCHALAYPAQSNRVFYCKTGQDRQESLCT